MDKALKRNLILLLAPLLIVFTVLYLFGDTDKLGIKSISYNEFLTELRGGNISEVKLDSRFITAIPKSEMEKPAEKRGSIVVERLPGIDESYLIKELEAKGVKFTGHTESSSWWQGVLFSLLLPVLLLLLIFGYGSRSLGSNSGALDFGKNRAKIYDQLSNINVKFADVAGAEEAKAELVEIVDFLSNPQKYQQLGGRIPKGVLLVGPPGTGKTLMARAVAGEAGVPFFSISGSEFVEIFVGVGAARVRDLFEKAKLKAPCIIFIDELDAIGKTRAVGHGMFMGHDEREQTLNQLLAEMDGFDGSRGLIIMAATNRPEVLDAALVRAGRFDRQVVIDKPDLAGREAILKVHARDVKLATDVELRTIAARTPGLAGADLANIINEAALLAARRGATAVEMHDLEEAIDRVMLGLEKKSRVMSAEEKRRIAYHETGHTLVALAVEHASPVHRVSIIPRSAGALGHTLQLPTREKYLMTRPELEDQITVMLAGRVAEELIFNGVISTGASDDLERVSELARQMVTRYGMSEQLGQITYGQPLAGRYLNGPFSAQERNYSERTARLIDMEIQRIIANNYARARTILTGRRAQMERVARELMARETLTRPDIEALISNSGNAAA